MDEERNLLYMFVVRYCNFEENMTTRQLNHKHKWLIRGFKILIKDTGLGSLEGLKWKKAQLYKGTAGNTENKQNASYFTALSREGSVYHQLGGDK